PLDHGTCPPIAIGNSKPASALITFSSLDRDMTVWCVRPTPAVTRLSPGRASVATTRGSTVLAPVKLLSPRNPARIERCSAGRQLHSPKSDPITGALARLIPGSNPPPHVDESLTW